MDTKSLYVFYAVTTYVGQTYTIRGIQKPDTTCQTMARGSLDNPENAFLIQKFKIM